MGGKKDLAREGQEKRDREEDESHGEIKRGWWGGGEGVR